MLKKKEKSYILQQVLVLLPKKNSNEFQLVYTSIYI